MVLKFEDKDINTPNYKKFLHNFVNPLLESLEIRRKKTIKKFIKLLCFSLIVSIAMFLAAPHIKVGVKLTVNKNNEIRGYVAENVIDLDDSYVEKIENKDQTGQINFTYYFICFLIPAICWIITFRVIYNYKNIGKKEFGDANSIKETIFNNLVKYFGNFTFNRAKGVSLMHMHGSNIIPEYLNYKSEDCISGEYNNVKIEMSESLFFQEEEGSNIAVFKGLVVLLDISSSDLVLRGDFKGNTLIIQDDKKDLSYIKDKFKDYETISFPTKEIDKRFEILTNNSDEAKKIVSESLLKKIIRLSDSIHTTSAQQKSVDDKLISFTKRSVLFLSELVQFIILLPFNLFNFIRGDGFYPPLSDSQFDDEKYYELIEDKKSEYTDEIKSFNDDLQCSFYRDKVLITIPHKKDLFELRSIFEPPLIEEDVELLYNMLSVVKNICDEVVKNKNNSNKVVLD